MKRLLFLLAFIVLAISSTNAEALTRRKQLLFGSSCLTPTVSAGLVARWLACANAGVVNGVVNNIAPGHGGANPGTASNGPGVTPFQVGSGLAFNGANQVVTGSDAGFPSGNAARTTSFWFSTTYGGSSDKYFYAYGAATSTNAWQIGMRSGQILFTQNGASCQTTATYDDGAPYFVMITWDGTTMNFYVGAGGIFASVAHSACSFTVNTSLSGFNIGRDQTTKYIAATINDLRQSSGALSLSSGQAIYTNNLRGIALLDRWRRTRLAVVDRGDDLIAANDNHPILDKLLRLTN